VIRALVFDFDGLVFDSEMPLFVAWQEAFAAHGCEPLTIEDWAAEIGTIDGLDKVGLLQARATAPVDVEAMHAVRRARVQELMALEALQPGVQEWLDAARAAGVPVAIASSSAPDWVEPMLERLGVAHAFAYVSCAHGSVPPKPAPHTYLRACEALGVEPAHALAIEDSPHGIGAAKRAGLWCLAVPNAITKHLDVTEADVVAPSLADVTMADVVARLA
jgi:HAD superfamily hydrolase (TIGR01509 family)